jgi:hypothetical protein
MDMFVQFGREWMKEKSPFGPRLLIQSNNDNGNEYCHT